MKVHDPFRDFKNEQVMILRNPSLRQLGEQILVWQPNVVYLTGENIRQPAIGKLPVLTWRAQEEMSEHLKPSAL